MNNPTPPRAPELQAALDWHLPMDQYNMLPLERKDAATQAWHNGDSELIIAAEVYRLEEQVRTLRTALESLVDAVNIEFPGGMRDIGGRTGPALIRACNVLAAQPSETKETTS